jgi:hypothetical protein
LLFEVPGSDEMACEPKTIILERCCSKRFNPMVAGWFLNVRNYMRFIPLFSLVFLGSIQST